jgi:hypothetical protein
LTSGLKIVQKVVRKIQEIGYNQQTKIGMPKKPYA